MKHLIAYLPLFLLLFSCEPKGHSENERAEAFFDHRTAILETSERSKDYTLTILDQTPDSLFGYRPTEEMFYFSQHFIHSAEFACDVLGGTLGFESPYKDYRPAPNLSKEDTKAEILRMYAFIEEIVNEMSPGDFEKEVEFGGESMAAWRVFQIVENHKVHHRGYSIVYLRLNGIAVKGYLGA
ncbi:DinB family protein [Arthrospiribacter ruber]|jgi:hypothetical protein|uniref:DinB family protein n=1 Tax=Arthrospiribacter ruber TaxID=2487934 RepID=A0A951MBN7_9BACT|nr:DinB family protein [Arthrospiribacter ruber]MBW3466932.1 DinB family protein [Arthrospiribacter ruber]